MAIPCKPTEDHRICPVQCRQPGLSGKGIAPGMAVLWRCDFLAMRFSGIPAWHPLTWEGFGAWLPLAMRHWGWRVFKNFSVLFQPVTVNGWRANPHCGGAATRWLLPSSISEDNHTLGFEQREAQDRIQQEIRCLVLSLIGRSSSLAPRPPGRGVPPLSRWSSSPGAARGCG